MTLYLELTTVFIWCFREITLLFNFYTNYVLLKRFIKLSRTLYDFSILFSFFSFHFIYLNSCILDPGFNGNFKVHNSQERIKTVTFTCNTLNNFLFCNDLIFLIIVHISAHFINSYLIFELNNLHFLIDFHGSIFSSHASV